MATLSVGISDWKICTEPDALVTYALGSCVGICLYDKARKICGLSHIMLPDSTSINLDNNALNRMKFADTAIPDMYNAMVKKGCTHNSLTAKIAGGAMMFNTLQNDKFNIGDRNVTAVRTALAKIRIPILAHDTGLNYGRTVFFYPEDGKVEVKSTGRGSKTL